MEHCMMRYTIGLGILGFFLWLPLHASDSSLTPAHEPYDDSFFVCYETCRSHYVINSLLHRYFQYQYLGCRISRQPCCQHRLKKRCQYILKKKCCKPIHYTAPCHLKEFGWYNTYLQALNGFYRCAYN